MATIRDPFFVEEKDLSEVFPLLVTRFKMLSHSMKDDPFEGIDGFDSDTVLWGFLDMLDDCIDDLEFIHKKLYSEGGNHE